MKTAQMNTEKSRSTMTENEIKISLRCYNSKIKQWICLQTLSVSRH